jgi:uncharacterized peroxidase-related enzyme
VTDLVRDWRSAHLDDSERAMLEFVEKLTLDPGQMIEQDVQQLRAAGFGDEDILEISLICSYYNMINRIAESLGAETEEEKLEGPIGQALPWRRIAD